MTHSFAKMIRVGVKVSLSVMLAFVCLLSFNASAFASPLSGSWQLVSPPQPSSESARLTTIEFERNRLFGNAYCNTYNAAYISAGNRIKVDVIATTKMACPGIGNQFEHFYLSRLQNIQTFTTDGVQLTLGSLEGSRSSLVYRRISPTPAQ